MLMFVRILCRSYQIVGWAYDNHRHNQIEQNLLPKHLDVGFLLCQKTRNKKEQRNAENIYIYVIKRKEMSVDNKADSYCFHPVNPIESFWRRTVYKWFLFDVCFHNWCFRAPIYHSRQNTKRHRPSYAFVEAASEMRPLHHYKSSLCPMWQRQWLSYNGGKANPTLDSPTTINYSSYLTLISFRRYSDERK